MSSSPHRISVKLYFADGVTIEPARIVPLFHEWIRSKSVEGLLIDVADYRHAREGPATVLIGHDVDYAVDFSEGRPGLLVTRKRPTEKGLSEDIEQGLRRALLAARALQRKADPHPPVRFRTDELRVQVIDRLRFPNNAPSVEAVRAALEPVLVKLFEGSELTIESAATDSRAPVTLRVRACAAADLDSLIERL